MVKRYRLWIGHRLRMSPHDQELPRLELQVHHLHPPLSRLGLPYQSFPFLAWRQEHDVISSHSSLPSWTSQPVMFHQDHPSSGLAGLVMLVDRSPKGSSTTSTRDVGLAGMEATFWLLPWTLHKIHCHWLAWKQSRRRCSHQFEAVVGQLLRQELPLPRG